MNALIGQPVGRVEDLPLLIGAGRFLDDVNLPRQAYAAFVRSPHAHANITAVRIAKAKAAQGVLAVLTGADYRADNCGPLLHYAIQPDHLDLTKLAFPPGTIIYDPLPPHFPIVAERVRHIGETVAMVVADSAEAARDAAELVEGDYEPLPAVTDALAAMAPDAPQLWDKGNVCVRNENGDSAAVEAAFLRAHRVIKLTTHNHRVCATPLEPRSAIGDFDPASGQATLYAPSQGVHRHKMGLTSALAIPQEKMRVVTYDVGGGFGVRSPSYPEYALVVWAARRLGRPVKWTATRAENFLTDFQARDVHIEGALALDKRGKFLGISFNYTGNLGAYPTTFAVLSNLLRMAGGAYDFHVAHVSVCGVLTNTVPVNVYRGAGRPKSTFIVERMIDLAAEEMGIDRAELRRRNMLTSVPYQSPLGHRYESGEFIANLDSARDAIDWDGFAERRKAAKKRGKLSGISIANYLESPTGAPMERSDISVHPEGRIDAVVGTQASGQGHKTVFAQVVADILQVPFEQVTVLFGDSAVAVSGGGTHSDRSMRLGGSVIYWASEEVVKRGRAIAAHLMEAGEADVEYTGGRFKVAGTDRSLGLFDVAAAATGPKVPEALRGPLVATSELKRRLHAHPNGVAACEVEIDPATGEVEIVRYVTVDDVGRVINPIIVDGQVHGGIAQGVGQALFEHCVYEPDTGQLLSGSFMDYCMPRADDFPHFNVAINGQPAPGNPLGVKGAGECGTTPACAIIIGAICDALRAHGVRHLEMPATPERVWRAIHEATV